MSSLGLVIAAVGASAVWRDVSPRLDGWTLLVIGGVLFSEAAARKIAAVVKRVEGTTMNKPIGRATRYTGGALRIGKTDAVHNKTAIGTISIWGGTPGSETDTGVNVQAYNSFANLASGKWVFVAHTGAFFYIVAAEC